MNKKLLVLLPLLATSLIGCSGQSGSSDKDLLNKALDSIPMVIDFSSGKEVLAVSTTIGASDGSSYLALNTLYWKETEFELNWTCAPASNWSVSEYATDTTRTRYMPLYGEEEFDCSLTLELSVAGKTEKVSQTWNFHAATHEKADLTDYTYISLENLQKEYAANNASHSGDKIYTYGKIVASMEPSETHLYAGVYIQDGAYGLMLYAGNLKTLWFNNGFSIGDTVMIAGVTSPYSGLLEVKPTYMEMAASYLAAEGKTVAEPVVTDISDMDWSLTGAGVYQSALVRMTGLTYTGVKADIKPGVHGEIYFKKGSTEVSAYVNYHIGSDAMNAIGAQVAGWTANETVVDFYGVLAIYNNPQILPVFGAESFTVAQ